MEKSSAINQDLLPRNAFKKLTPLVKTIVRSDVSSIWEQDTRSLPKELGAYRRKMKHWAHDNIKLLALERDLDPYRNGNEELLIKAGRDGLLSDFLPFPFGSSNIIAATKPLHLVQSIKMEELCSSCSGLGLMIGAHGLGTMPLILSGDQRIIRKFVLPAYNSNKKGKPYLFAFAITEPSAGSDVEDTEGASVATPRCVAKKVQKGWLLNGSKVFISGGDIAKAVCVFAALENEGFESWTCFLVEKTMKGFNLGRNEHKMGQRASSATELVFEDVFVPDAHVVGGLRKGWALNRAVLNFSRIPVGAIALGIGRGALEAAIEFACKNKLDGKSLINYQQVQLSIAQMSMEVSAMRAMVWQSASNWTPTQAKASMTKVFCSDTAVKVCEQAMELMGNHGFLHSNLVEKAYRDARLTQIYEGTNEINRLAIIEDQVDNWNKTITNHAY
ncbi:MAG: acyl-CoA dehydrogenase [Bacteroidetes bacterium]|nr:acyl-CoA dehydrogenase [Bacteroidota bacterium]